MLVFWLDTAAVSFSIASILEPMFCRSDLMSPVILAAVVAIPLSRKMESLSYKSAVEKQ